MTFVRKIKIKTLKKIWKKIGEPRQHTLHRLKQHGILKLEDEIAIQEAKYVWKWEKGKLPPGSKQLLVEKQDNLRRRRFERYNRIGLKTINSRLAKRAENCIETVKNFNTKKTMVKNLKQSLINDNYTFICRNRACFICRE
jgi:hypothetical protein